MNLIFLISVCDKYFQDLQDYIASLIFVKTLRIIWLRGSVIKGIKMEQRISHALHVSLLTNPANQPLLTSTLWSVPLTTPTNQSSQTSPLSDHPYLSSSHWLVPAMTTPTDQPCIFFLVVYFELFWAYCSFAVTQIFCLLLIYCFYYF